MPSPIFTALAAVPWRKVISHAPAVLDAAVKLRSNMAKGTRPSAVRVLDGRVASHDGVLSNHEERLADTEKRINEIDNQVNASSDVIKSLAEQTSHLILEIESLRRRNTLLFLLFGGVVVATIGMAFWVAHVTAA